LILSQSRKDWVLKDQSSIILQSQFLEDHPFLLRPPAARQQDDNMPEASAKTLIISHSVTLAVGFAMGKFMDYEELKTYRGANESFMAKWRRRIGTAGIGFAALAVVAYSVKIASRTSTKAGKAIA
jgi:hypothetical protein